MIKKGYWSESFSEQEIEIIKLAWSNVFFGLLPGEDQEIELKRLVKRECNKMSSSFFMTFPKPENDKEDGWTGIEPETFKNFFTILSKPIEYEIVEYMVKALIVYKKTSTMSFIDNDRIVDWESVAKSFSSFVNNERANFITHFNRLISTCFESETTFHSMLIKIREEGEIAAMENLGIPKEDWKIFSKTFTISNIQTRVSEMTKEWQKFQHTPKRLPVLLQYPTKEFIRASKKLDEILTFINNVNTKLNLELTKLEKEVYATNLCLIYALYKIDEELVTKNIEANPKSNLTLLTFPTVTKKLTKKMVELLSTASYQHIEMLLTSSETMLEFASLFPPEKHAIAIEAHKISDGDLDFAKQLVKYNVAKHRWQEYKKLYQKAIGKNVIDKFQKFRVLKHINGDYSAYISPKSSAEALLSGEATNCCMTTDYPGEGFKCLSDAMLDKNAAILIVEKNGVIFAQSWLWIAKSGNKKAICFDSIETVFKEKDQLLMIFKMVKDFADLLKKTKKIDFLWFGEKTILTDANVDRDFYRVADEIFDAGYVKIINFEKISEDFGLTKEEVEELTKRPEWVSYSDMKNFNSEIAIFTQAP